MVEIIKITEAQFARQVIELARIYHWKVYHTWSSVHSPMGFPDLTLARAERLVFAELKSEEGKLTLEQKAWLDILKETGKCEVYVWQPRDWPTILEVLK